MPKLRFTATLSEGVVANLTRLTETINKSTGGSLSLNQMGHSVFSHGMNSMMAINFPEELGRRESKQYADKQLGLTVKTRSRKHKKHT
jgi:hypothetical protein